MQNQQRKRPFESGYGYDDSSNNNSGNETNIVMARDQLAQYVKYMKRNPAVFEYYLHTDMRDKSQYGDNAFSISLANSNSVTQNNNGCSYGNPNLWNTMEITSAVTNMYPMVIDANNDTIYFSEHYPDTNSTTMFVGHLRHTPLPHVTTTASAFSDTVQMAMNTAIPVMSAVRNFANEATWNSRPRNTYSVEGGSAYERLVISCAAADTYTFNIHSSPPTSMFEQSTEKVRVNSMELPLKDNAIKQSIASGHKIPVHSFVYNTGTNMLTINTMTRNVLAIHNLAPGGLFHMTIVSSITKKTFSQQMVGIYTNDGASASPSDPVIIVKIQPSYFPFDPNVDGVMTGYIENFASINNVARTLGFTVSTTGYAYHDVIGLGVAPLIGSASSAVYTSDTFISNVDRAVPDANRTITFRNQTNTTATTVQSLYTHNGLYNMVSMNIGTHITNFPYSTQMRQDVNKIPYEGAEPVQFSVAGIHVSDKQPNINTQCPIIIVRISVNGIVVGNLQVDNHASNPILNVGTSTMQNQEVSKHQMCTAMLPIAIRDGLSLQQIPKFAKWNSQSDYLGGVISLPAPVPAIKTISVELLDQYAQPLRSLMNGYFAMTLRFSE